MDLETIRNYALQKEGAEECFPFGADTLVYKAWGKIFMICGMDRHPPELNLKCLPERAIELREAYSSIVPGYHMNKKHWNTVCADHSIPRELVFELIDHSFELVAPKKKKK